MMTKDAAAAKRLRVLREIQRNLQRARAKGPLPTEPVNLYEMLDLVNKALVPPKKKTENHTRWGKGLIG